MAKRCIFSTIKTEKQAAEPAARRVAGAPSAALSIAQSIWSEDE
jgi:hypothetical protein